LVVSSYYKNGTNDGTPESHARNDGNTGSLASQVNVYQAKMGAKMDDNKEKMDANIDANQ
jgi:hypothetical protein